MVLQELITLIIFTAILAKTSEIAVESAVKLANFFRVRTLAIGMLLVAAATSLPELSVSIVSSAGKHGAIAAGNVFGSNIANILLILGLGAFVYGFKVKKETLSDIALVLTLTTILSVYVLFHSQVSGSALGFYEGILLLAAASWHGFRMLHKKKISGPLGKEEAVGKKNAFKAFLFFGIGIVGVLFSSSMVVDAAVKLAEEFGLAQSFIGATIIAVGTSLPELSIVLQSIRKREYELAIGDAIGGNMATMTLALGAAAVINPIFVQLQVFIAALLFAIISNAIFTYISVVHRAFGRREGALMLILYAAYLIAIFALQFREAGFL